MQFKSANTALSHEFLFFILMLYILLFAMTNFIFFPKYTNSAESTPMHAGKAVKVKKLLILDVTLL